MAHFFTSYDAASGNGRVFVRPLTATSPTTLLTQQSLNVRPVILKYRKRTYTIGQFSRGLVFTENAQLVTLGILAPNTTPTLTPGAFAGGDEGIQIGYLTFIQKISGKVLHESNPSAQSASIELNGNGRTWGNIPATSPDERVTHVRGYVSLDGDIPSLAWERPLGVTTVTENSLNAERFITLPTYQGLDGEVSLDINARGVHPYCQFAEVYHDSMYYAGDPVHPERVYKSRIFEPESVNAVESSDDSPSGYFVTPDGEAVTGLKRWNDLLIVTCLRCVYSIQGFASTDIQFIKLTNFYGCVSNASLVRVGPRGDLWGAGQEGVWSFDGTFHDLMDEDLRDYWTDNYATNATTFQQSCFAAEDRRTRVYILQTPKPSDQPAGITSFKWIGHWMPTLNGQDPWWTFDGRARTDSAMGVLLAADDSTFLDFYTGSCDGIIRKDNVAADSNDNNDTYAKALTILSKHFFFGDQCGDDSHGRKYTNLDVFLKNESTIVNVGMYGGDDTASNATSPQWNQDIPAGAVVTPRPRVARTSLRVDPASVNGKGVSVKFTATAPVDVRLRGFAIYHIDGQQERPYTD